MRLEEIRIEQEPCRRFARRDTLPRRIGTSCFAGRDVDDRSFALAMRGRAASLGLISLSSGWARLWSG